MMYSAWTMAAMAFPSLQIEGRDACGRLASGDDPAIGLQEWDSLSILGDLHCVRSFCWLHWPWLRGDVGTTTTLLSPMES